MRLVLTCLLLLCLILSLISIYRKTYPKKEKGSVEQNV